MSAVRLRTAVLLCFVPWITDASSAFRSSVIEPDDSSEPRGAVALPSSTNGQPFAYWTPSSSRREQLSNIFWTHIPKTSTTFARTIFAYACGEQSDDFMHTRTNAPPRPQHGSCTGTLAQEQDDIANAVEGGNVSWYHMPVPWTQPDTSIIPTSHVRVITLLRDPAVRMRSEFLHMSGPNAFICCGPVNLPGYLPGTSWGWDRLHRLPAILKAQGRIVNLTNVMNEQWDDHQAALHDPTLNTTSARARAYREFLNSENALFGCQTKMLLGYGCHEAYQLTPLDRELARRYVVSDSLAFVGLTERYAESVCLFHAIFGKPMWNFEVDPDSTPAYSPEGASNDPLTHHAASEDISSSAFYGSQADPDEEMYALATQRFDEAIERHREDVTECLSRLPLSRGRTAFAAA